MPSDTPHMLMRRAARHHLAGELREAASLYRKLLQDDPQHAGALHALGVMAQQTGRDDAAEKLLLRAVATDPSFAAAHDDLGALWLLQGKLEQAVAAFAEATRVQPRHALAHAHLGAALLMLGRAEQAAAAYQRAVDAAVSSFRRLRTVGIDVRAATDGLSSVAPPLAGSSPEAEPALTGARHGFSTLTAEEDEDGVVGLTLVPPSAIGGMIGDDDETEPDVPSPLTALAEAVGVAYASMARTGWSTSAIGPMDIPMGVEPEAAALIAEWPDEEPAAGMPDGLPADLPVFLPMNAESPALPPIAGEEDLFPWGHARPAHETPHVVPVIEAEVGDPRYDAPQAMLGGGIHGRAAMPASRSAGMVADDQSADSNGHSGRDRPATPTLLDLSGGEGAYTLSQPPQTPEDGQGAVELLDPEPASSELAPIELAEVEIDDEDPLSSESAEVDLVDVVEAAPDEPLPHGELPIEILPVDPAIGADLSSLPAAQPVRVRPPVTRVVLPASAARLAEDPVMASRQLAKDLRRARRTPVPDAQQAAKLQKQGARHLRQRRVEEAIAALQRLVELQPGSAKAHRDLGAAYIRADRLDEATVSLTRALELRPRFADAFASLGDVYHLQGRVEEAIACYRQTLALRPTAASAHSNLLLTLNYQRKTETQALFTEHVKWGRAHAAPLAREILPHDNDPTPARQIRIGYVSGDFRRHAVGSFIEPILANRDADGFHVICYSDVLRPDETTERLSVMCDGWRDIRGLSDADVADMVRHDRIDILVDLAGHTGNNRLCVFARKPAPVQVSYLGYPNTTGLPTMDYRLSDAWADPLGQTEQFHTEQLYRLPRGFLCYQPPADAPPAAPPPIVASGHVTFGCFNILAKLTPETLGLWAKIMTVLPKSRMVLKDRLGTLSNPGRRRHVQDIFAYHRIAADRLDLLDKEPDRLRHLQSYCRVDIMLDPFPYNGTTTTCEALWMGVPVITLAGTRHASRVGVSILKSAGLPEFVTANIEAYARSAVLLGRDINRLTMLRKTLRQKIGASALTDGPRFTKSLGQAYREMWEYWCQSHKRPVLPAADRMSLEA